MPPSYVKDILSPPVWNPSVSEGRILQQSPLGHQRVDVHQAGLDEVQRRDRCLLPVGRSAERPIAIAPTRFVRTELQFKDQPRFRNRPGSAVEYEGILGETAARRAG